MWSTEKHDVTGAPVSPHRGREIRTTLFATLAFAALAVYFTWPSARGLTRDVPWDLGDSLLVMWVLSWDVSKLNELATGHLDVLTRWFDANIFHPAPLTLAYSEHLLPQALTAWPIQALTGNPLLAYQLIFLSTYVLSGLGTYLLVRELTGDRRAAFLAGLLFAFSPYRNSQAAHVQVLSSQWMPFTLYGFTRYLNTGRRPALAWGTAALVAQGLSCGYYLLFFPPVAAFYVLWELARRGRLRDTRAWIDFSVAALVTALVVAPFLVPYARIRTDLQMARSIEEMQLYSADVYSYLTVLDIQRVWGPLLDGYQRAEGQLFPGAIPCLLTLLAVGQLTHRAWRGSLGVPDARPLLSASLLAIAIAALVVALVALFARRLDVTIAGIDLRVSDVRRVLIWSTGAFALLLTQSARARAAMRVLATTETFFLLAIVACWWLSLGPAPTVAGRPVEFPAPYRALTAVPGFDGLRVPARFAMLVMLGLAIASGYAVAALRLRSRQGGLALVTVLSVLFLIEAPVSTFPVNQTGGSQGKEPPEARVYPPGRTPGLYADIAALGPDTVLLELPVGEPNWDIRAVFYSSGHWHRLVNGYSGFFPPHYGALVAGLADPARNEALSWTALRGSQATHVLVHEQAYRAAEAEQIRHWLDTGGARVLRRLGPDVLYEVPR